MAVKLEGSIDEIAEAFRRKLDAVRITCDQYLIIDLGTYYVQLMPNRDTVYGEAVSNAFLEGPDRLTANEERQLVELGWSPPDEPCHSTCTSPHPNHHRLWSQEASSDTIVADMFTTLITVYMRGEGQRFVLSSETRKTPISSGPPSSH
jgi:hypothetical protein